MTEETVTPTERPSTPAADEILGLYFPALDHGFVSLIDYMGSDNEIERAARVSYGAGTRKTSETRGLLRHLRRHKHTTPSEMVEMKFHCCMPIFVARQWIRHRTACLTADTQLQFDLPGGLRREGRNWQSYKLSVGEIYERFQPTTAVARRDKQKNPHFKRERVQRMLLRSVDESTREITHTRIVDIWQSGRKTVYRVELANGASASMSADHLCWTDVGWRKLREIVELPARQAAFIGPSKIKIATIAPGASGVQARFVDPDVDAESWAPVVGWEGFYEVSDEGRVRRTMPAQGVRDFGNPKKVTVSNGHGVVSLSREAVTTTYLVHRLVLEAFVGPCPEGAECCHGNGNGLDNRLDNLRWDTPQANANDRVRDGATTRLGCVFEPIVHVGSLGEEMTYDLEVAGPWHNFCAGGMIVHNSVNEYSGRYSLMPMLFYTPPEDQFRKQSTTNKQGRSDEGDAKLHADTVKRWNDSRATAQILYSDLTGADVARELCRIDLPLSTYTQWYWKIDLHNLLHFLGLRVDSHAQWEIQQFGEIMAGMLKRVAPLSYEAWIDYEVCGVRLSRGERWALASIARTAGEGGSLRLQGQDKVVSPQDMKDWHGLSPREITEFLDKMRGAPARPDIPDFELDLSVAKPGSYFEERFKAAVPGNE